MKKLIYLFSIVMALLVSSCSKDDIDGWSSKGYVWFSHANVDFTFRTHSDISTGGTYLVGIPFRVASKMSDKDRTVNVEVAAEPKDSRTKYDIQRPVLLHAGNATDTMFVKVTNTENLDVAPDTVKFKITDSDDFYAGLKDSINTNLCLYNGFARPEWWDSDAERYFGYFTQLKMQIYWTVTGGDADPRNGGEWYNNLSVTYLVQVLNDYVTEHNIRYPDDDPNAPGQTPKFKRRSY